MYPVAYLQVASSALFFLSVILNSNILLYADDLVIYMSINRINHQLEKEVAIFQNDLNHINTWCTNNKLTINGEKTKYMYFPFNNRNSLGCGLKLGDTNIEPTRSYTYLGVVLDMHLTFKPYLNQVRRNASYKL